MMLFFALYIVIVCVGLRFRRHRTTEYLDMEHTQSVKGIFILLVFFSHFNLAVTFDSAMDLRYAKIVQFFGQTMVTMFMFYSGYGVMESVKKKGLNYINSIPQKRILGTMLRFDTAILIYVVVSAILGEFYSPTHYALAFLGWESVGSSHWYIFDIVLLYLLTYMAFRFTCWQSKERPTLAAIIVLIFTCIGILILVRYPWIKPVWWYDTILCYSMGLLYSLYKDRIENIINCSLVSWAVSAVLAWLVFYFFKTHSNNIWMVIGTNISFCFALTITTMRLLLHNKVLVWCGQHLFEIFILHRIPLLVLQHFAVDKYNVYLFFVGCVVITAGLIIPFKKLTDVVVIFSQRTFKYRTHR